ncbi:glycoside hydrolase family 127 protein [Cellulomonas sp. C5510]|uniref:glycoside hydrolase family 127 protein n=1 Tax=Cellulomonas sp. C5510 TaxID=2871170 RepID=UPI001C938C11|nr:beta-L-arabinofuranosidase domain-containing protein [Cellulomonas sp. C5510]QZN85332.1 glycoside hydrolase family 127 protein [Cellulomonas sp. C5510]
MTTPVRSTTTAPPVTPVAPSAGALRPLGLDEVVLTEGFWADRQRVNGTASIPHCDHWETRVGWIANFERAVDGTLVGARTGREFSDSDVYKLIEAMAWEAGRTGDPALEARIAELAALLAQVQEPDGYLSTRFGRPGQEPRYSDLEWGHELYCFGHLIQAAVARLRTGHDDELVAVARRAADHVCAEFGPDGRDGVCGHPEIEVALAELARATGERRYLDQAALFVERRGRGTLAAIELGREYYQDDVPVREAEVLRGHAVRALYLAAGALDVAVETGDDALLDAVRGQYERTLARRTYLTGGMGAHHQDEAYGDDYELPPDRAYCETCAGVASVMVAWRLLLATGDVAWGDVVERALYNVVATSPRADGRAFFYTNPLHKRVPGTESAPDEVSARALSRLRAPWFEVSCCPTNVARTVAALGGYVAAVSEDALHLVQLASARVTTRLGDGRAVGVEVVTGYPVDGDVVVRVVDAPEGEWTIALRVPAWAAGSARVDGAAAEVTRGEVRVTRAFAPGDELRLTLDVAPRVTVADPRVDAVRGTVAVERGPVVLCAESVDLPGGADVAGLRVDPAGPVVGDGDGARVRGRLVTAPDAAWPYAPAGSTAGDPDGGTPVEVRLVPYHSWANRGPSTMRVWLPTA